jgi:two-component system cell cycle response regulator
MANPPINVLVAEDDQISGRILERHIKGWGYKPYLAQDGEQAWEIFQNNPIEVAILDWMMPRVNGLELCRRIRQPKYLNHGSYVYIILLTARDEREDLLRGLSSGADDYIIKPFDPLELRARLNTGRRIIELQRLLKKQATYDALTGLLNRRSLLGRAQEEYSRRQRENKPLGLILFDVDDFKKINDTYGHQTGDAILSEVAKRLRRGLRQYDHVGRYGGDEILALLPNCDCQALQKISERLAASIAERPILYESHTFSVSVSAGGLSTENYPSLSLQELIALSDKALYQAKRAGRNRVVILEAGHSIGGEA